MPPNLVPIVATGKLKMAVAAAPATTAISIPGHRGIFFLRPTMTTIVAMETTAVVGSREGKLLQRTGTFKAWFGAGKRQAK